MKNPWIFPLLSSLSLSSLCCGPSATVQIPPAKLAHCNASVDVYLGASYGDGSPAPWKITPKSVYSQILLRGSVRFDLEVEPQRLELVRSAIGAWKVCHFNSPFTGELDFEESTKEHADIVVNDYLDLPTVGDITILGNTGAHYNTPTLVFFNPNPKYPTLGVVVHEIGHSLLSDHIPGTVMNPSAAPDMPTTPNEYVCEMAQKNFDAVAAMLVKCLK